MNMPELQAIIISFWVGEWGVMLYVFPALLVACPCDTQL